MAEETHFQGVLVDGEVLAAPVLLLAVFAGSLIIGLRALAPVEQSRRRQLDFTADASHELRTPLTVIAAETNIALSSPRDAAGYRSALTRIQGESQRLRTIVEDLLWLARFDSNPPPPGDEPIDLGVIAEECARRFGAVARAESIEITVVAGPAGPQGDGARAAAAAGGSGASPVGTSPVGADPVGADPGSPGPAGLRAALARAALARAAPARAAPAVLARTVLARTVLAPPARAAAGPTGTAGRPAMAAWPGSARRQTGSTGWPGC